MDSKERVFEAISGRVPDRVPLSLTASLYGAALIGGQPSEYYTTPQMYLEGQAKLAEMLQPDILFTPFALPLFAAAFGAKIHFPGFNPPNVSGYLDYTPGEVPHLRVESALAHPVSTYLTEAARLVAEGPGQQKVLASILISPVDLPAMMFGVDRWLHTLLFFPTSAGSIIEALSAYCTAMAERFVASGAAVLVIPANFTNLQIVTKRIANSITLPALEQWLLGLSCPVVFHHGGPDLLPMLPRYASLPSTIGFVPSALDKMRDVRSLITDGQVIIGNIDGPSLSKSTPDSIRKRCLRVLRDNASDGRFILGTSNADIPYTTPLANILAMHESILEYNAERVK